MNKFGFSTLLIVIPVALIVAGLLAVRFLTPQPKITPPIEQVIKFTKPPVDPNICSDPYNADCYYDEEGDFVEPDQLKGSD